MMESNPDAIFDCLYIGKRLQRKINDFSMYEIQFFSYFSCLLSLYDGNPVESWNYSFIRTEFGSPYSIEIHKSIQILTSGEFLREQKDISGYYAFTPKGVEYLNYFQAAMQSISWRKKYLDTACTSISLLPYGDIKEAINSEPVLNSARHSQKRNLLLDSNPATKVLYSQFKALRTALEDKYTDLIVPATVWIDALNKEKNEFV
ncbi:MAG TPA: hypothetical protein VD993_15320 [Chitinophagaceae bacterium]|nr:hypothetical protein [Chitinophagaceae bacterium]